MTSGQEDEIRAGITGSRLVVFEKSSHYPFAEEPGRFLDALEDFLARAEARTEP